MCSETTDLSVCDCVMCVSAVSDSVSRALKGMMSCSYHDSRMRYCMPGPCVLFEERQYLDFNNGILALHRSALHRRARPRRTWAGGHGRTAHTRVPRRAAHMAYFIMR
jgi:hypothetical protein